MKKQKEEQKIEKGTAVAMFYCDAWKSGETMSLKGIFTNRKKLNTAIRFAKRDKDIELANGEMKDLKYWDIQTINNNFDYLYLEAYTLNKKG